MFTINNTNNGVEAFVTGFKTKDLQAKIQECQDGNCSCDCDPSMMQKIQKIDVQSKDEGTSITISGDVNAEELEPMMKGCLV